LYGFIFASPSAAAQVWRPLTGLCASPCGSPLRVSPGPYGVYQDSRDWERRRTSIRGVFIVKAPASGRRPAQLIVELNPLGPHGQPSKRRGLYVRSLGELEEYRRLVESPGSRGSWRLSRR